MTDSELKQNDILAMDRTRMAAERTLMAWVRTAFTAISVTGRIKKAVLCIIYALKYLFLVIYGVYSSMVDRLAGWPGRPDRGKLA